jgi:hypothetical protein
MKCQIEGVYSLVNSSKQGAEGGGGSDEGFHVYGPDILLFCKLLLVSYPIVGR